MSGSEVNRAINKDIEYDKHVKIDTTLNYGYYEKLRIVERLKRENKSDEKICSKLNIKKSELDNLVSQNQEVKRQLQFRKKWCFDGGPDNENEEFSDNDITRLIKNQMEYDIRATSTVEKNIRPKRKKIKNKFNESIDMGKCRRSKVWRLHFYITN